MARQRTNQSHKFDGVGISGQCSCGWVGANWRGRGARLNAIEDWRCHRENCEKEAED